MLPEMTRVASAAKAEVKNGCASLNGSNPLRVQSAQALLPSLPTSDGIAAASAKQQRQPLLSRAKISSANRYSSSPESQDGTSSEIGSTGRSSIGSVGPLAAV